MANAFTVAKKELRDSVGDRVFLAIYLILLIIIVTVAIPSAAEHRLSLQLQFQGVSENDPNMSLYDAQTTSASLINSLRTLIPVLSFLCPVLALLISFNSVNGEIEDGTLKVSLSYPLYRDQIFLGKLLNGFFVTFLTSFSAMLVGFAVYIYLSGVIVSLDLLSRIFIIAFSTTLYMMIFFSLGLLFSIYFNNPVKSFLLGVITWIIAINVYKQVINLVADLLFGIRIDQRWGSEIATYMGYSPSPSNKLSYESFINICSIFDINSNYGKILENSLNTLSVISYSTKGFVVNNIYVGAILSTLYNPLTVMLSLIIIINLFSYSLFIRKEVV